MVDDRLKYLEGPARRNFIRWATAAGAFLALDRSKVLDVIADTAGSGMADAATCVVTNRSVHLVGGVGGFAWFQLLWPHVEIAKANNPQFAFHANGRSTDALDTDKPFVHAPEAPWQKLDKRRRISAFMAGKNQAHLDAPDGGLTLSSGNDLLATVAAIQSDLPSLLPVIAIKPFPFGMARGAPSVASVADADGMVELFNSAASRQTLAVENDANLFEAYYYAFLRLNAAATLPTRRRALSIGEVSANFLGRNLAAQLSPSMDDITRYDIGGGTESKILEIGKALITTAKAFKLGLTQSIIIPAMLDDPHGAFGDAVGLERTVKKLGKVLDEFMNDLIAIPDPLCVSRSLADNVILTVHGDTPKDPLVRGAWPDGTPGDSNWIYVMGNGHLKTGWFGGIKANGSIFGFDPATGDDIPNQSSMATSAAASAAVAFAVAKGDMRRVQDFYNGPSIAGIVNQSPV